MTDASGASSAAPKPARPRVGRVEPRTLRGFIDYLPERALARLRLLDAIRPVVERYGFAPVETPIVEHLETLVGAGGEESNKELFRFESPEEEPIALRFDLTVPFARLLAQYPEELKLPFRRYAFGPVFRADKPGPGRFRQFTQFDMDAAGSGEVAVDAEICAVLCEALTALGVGRFRLEINSRRLVDAMLHDAGITEVERQKHVLRVVDKLAKVGLHNVRLELAQGRIDESGDPIRGVGLEPDQIERIVAFLALGGDSRRAVLASIDSFLKPSSLRDEALAEMQELAACLDVLGLDDAAVPFVPSLARGLDYYTGPVFEMKLPDAPQFGTVAAGGRYDGLVQRFSPNQVSATGASFGVDRLLAAIESLAGVPPRRTTTQVLITVFRGVAREEYLRMASELRRAGFGTEVFFGKKKASLTDQLSHANALGIPVAVIAGGDELARGEVAVKDLRAGAAARAGIEDHEAYREAGKSGQVTIARTDLIRHIAGLLG